MKLLSLFSGIGAFEKALTNIGVDYELVGFSEIDKWAIESYCAIHDIDKSLNLGDVSKINNEDLPKEVDMVTYGFPCQDISVAGQLQGINENTRSGLLYEAERVIQVTKPKYAIAENVKNLVGKKFKSDFDELLQRLDNYGYNNYWKVLNAKDYGIPQNRERVFIVSIRKDIDDGTFEFPKPIGTPSIVKFLDVIPTVDKYNNRYDILIKSLSRQNKLNHLQVFEDRRDEGARTFKHDMIGTLRTIDACGDKRVLRLKNKEVSIYKLSPLEAFKLMGFNIEDFNRVRGCGTSSSQMYKQAGNSIVVNVLEHIFIKLLKEEIENELE